MVTLANYLPLNKNWPFSKKIGGEIINLIGYRLEISPHHCILAADVDNAKNKHNTKLIGILLYIARKVFLKHWISKDATIMKDWYGEILKILPLEKLTFTLHVNIRGFIKI